MRNPSLLVAAAFTVLLLASCAGPIESLTFTSPKGDRSISIVGERKLPGDPITLTVTLTIPTLTKTFTFEHQAASLTREKVSAVWVNDHHCDITFTYDDGGTWVLETYLLDDKVQAIRNFAIDGKSIFN